MSARTSIPQTCDVRFGSKADIRGVEPMSAITPKADMAWTIGDVRFVPFATEVQCSKIMLLNNLVSGDTQRLRHRDAELLGRFEIDNQQIFHRRLHWKLRW